MRDAAVCVRKYTVWITINMGIPPTDKVEQIWLWSNGKNAGRVDQSGANIFMANVGGVQATFFLRWGGRNPPNYIIYIYYIYCGDAHGSMNIQIEQ